jgi:carboxypeptidase Q
MKKNTLFTLFLIVFGAFSAISQTKTTAADKFEPIGIDSIFRKIGLSQSQVMDIAWDITDGNGPRVTGSAGLDRATVAMVERLKSWNLANVHTEEWGPFGRGWELQSFQLESLDPFYMPLIAYPKAWSSQKNIAAN